MKGLIPFQIYDSVIAENLFTLKYEWKYLDL